MKLSIVSTLYCSERYIHAFCARASAAAEQLVGGDYEIVLVNDGSPDSSLAVATALAQDNPHLVVVDLSRNFGHHKAMMAGLAHARGDSVFLLDSDLEEEPEWLLRFSAQRDAEACDVVFGVQSRRKGNAFERLSGHCYYYVYRKLTRLDLPRDLVTARLMSRRYVDALLSHEEREVLISGLWHITGFEQRPCTVQKLATSDTTYTLGKKLSVFVNSVTSFSNTPLIAIFYVGVFIFFFAMLYTTYIVVQWLFMARPVDGWTSLIASIWLLGGMKISFIGVVGIYLSKIFSETKRRPNTIVRAVHTYPAALGAGGDVREGSP